MTTQATMMTHVSNPITWKENAGRPGVQGHPHLHSKLRSSLCYMSTEGLIPAPMYKKTGVATCVCNLRAVGGGTAETGGFPKPAVFQTISRFSERLRLIGK